MKMSDTLLDSPIATMNGVGEKRARLLMKLGIETVRDLLYYVPRSYENRGNIKTLSDGTDGNTHAFLLTVSGHVSTARLRGNLTVSKFRAFDDSGSVEVVFFNQPYIKDVFREGETYRFWGKLTPSRSHFTLSSPKYEPYAEGVPLDDFVPVYTVTNGISGKIIDKLVKTALGYALPHISDPMSERIRTENSLPTLAYAIKNMHAPEDSNALSRSLKRLAFDELFTFALGIRMSARLNEERDGIKCSPCSVKPLTDLLPYELTGAQKRTVNEIYSDMTGVRSDRFRPMSRIVIGDVGSGKTVCAMMAAYIAIKSGYQAAMMVPTEILARQHYAEFLSYFENLGITTRLLLGSTGKKEKEKIYRETESGECSMLIGTHALINEKVKFKCLCLTITDEQHRFGALQRAALQKKDDRSHLLVMSATPIPRTLALAMYGDLDISRVDEMPKGRLRVLTYALDESYRPRILDFIRKQVSLGGQVYIICPAIEEKDGSDDTDSENLTSMKTEQGPFRAEKGIHLKNAVDYSRELSDALPDLKISCLHGKLSSAEKDRIMTEFAEGRSDVLVSTTVIEVGVNVPNATLMIIENAERFGLSQIHQLRGRVGRGEKQSYCILMSDSKGENAGERLRIATTTYDGYEIAEKDLLMRGPGDFFAQNSDNNLRQSGGIEFKFAKLCNSTELMDMAFRAAEKTIREDPELMQRENLLLRDEISRLFRFGRAPIS